MNQNDVSLKTRSRFVRSVLVLCCLFLFATVFAVVLSRNWPQIAKKDLYAHDESVNSVVAANVARKFWPAMVRVNPISEKVDIWMEGPYWQHIPPLFAYAPWSFFKIDGHITIEMKRLAYAMLLLLAGIIFILSVYYFEKTYAALLAALVAAISLIVTPYTKQLMAGMVFGASDIVLAFTVICSFATLLWYLANPRDKRVEYSIKKLAFISLIIVLPILTKNVLGAIPAATYFAVLFYDHRKINSKTFASLLSICAIVFIYFVALFLSSPATFRQEIFVSFAHTKDFEGWARPWYIFFTNYLPRYYLRWFTPAFALSMLVGLLSLFKNKFQGRTKIILILSASWFFWNLLAVSAIKSKSPNFIFQTYLLSLFFAIYVPILLLLRHAPSLKIKFNIKKLELNFFLPLLVFLIALFAYSWAHLFIKIHQTRAASYSYNSEHKKFYQFAEIAQKDGANTRDLFILNSSPDDCWFRYYILFLTGAEARTFDESETPPAKLVA